VCVCVCVCYQIRIVTVCSEETWECSKQPKATELKCEPYKVSLEWVIWRNSWIFRRHTRQNWYKSFTVSLLFLFSVVLYLTHYNQIRCSLSSINESKLEDKTILSKTWNEKFEILIPLNTINVKYHQSAMKEFKRWVDHFEGKWQIRRIKFLWCYSLE